MGNLSFSHGGNIYAVKRNFKKDVIDFSANINPLGLPSPVKEAIYKSFDGILHYPDPEAKDLTRKIAQYWEIKEENILVGNGSIEFIYLIMSCFMPKTTLIPVPTFSEYERAARNVKSRIKFINLREKENFRLKPNRLSNSDIIFFSNPNNPTGNLILPESKVVEKLPNKLIVADEAFMDFLPDEEHHTLIWKAQKSKKIIVLRTFTKFFALPGLRVGYLVAHKDVIQFLKRYQMPWSVNIFAQKAARIILADSAYINNTRLFINEERKFLFDEISKINGLSLYPSVTNFLLVRIRNKSLNSSVLAKSLIQRGILIRDCANFRGLSDKFIRIAMRSHKENLILLRALREVI